MGPGMALMNRFSALATALVFAALAGCGAVSGLVGLPGGNQSVNLDALSRDKIAEFGMPILRAKVPALGLDLLMSIRDTRNGVVTWEAAEGITFSFRDGILVDSRGLGADLMSSAPPSAAQVRGSAGYARTYYFASEEDRNERRDYSCTPVLVGQEAVTIYGRDHQTRHLREECQRDLGKIANDYWFEGNTLRQSRQWIAPSAGYAEFSRVID